MSLSVASHAARVVADDAGTAPEQESTADRTPQRIAGAVTNEPDASQRVIAPPYMRETRGDVTTTAVFPIYFDRKAPRNHARLITPYYYKRSAELNADVLGGLIWSLRGPDRNTFILPPLYTHHDKKDWGFGLAPLLAVGEYDARFHLVIPPLLTWHDQKGTDHRTIVGPYFSFKKADQTMRGLFPLVWSKKDDTDRYTVVPPLFFHFADDDPLRKTTIVPPFYFLRRDKETSYGLVPLFFRSASPTETSTTIPALLFQHARSDTQLRVITPLVGYIDDQKDGRTTITALYQRKRGDKNYDGVLPFFFRSWDDRDMSDGLFVPPFFFRSRDPANDSLTFLPFFGRYQHDGVSNTWVTPFVGRYRSFEHDEQNWWFPPTLTYGWDEHSRHFNLQPLVYYRRGDDHSHLALTPFWFDFQNHEKRTRRTTLFPLYWNFRDDLVGNKANVLAPLYWDFTNGKKRTHTTVGFPFYWEVTKSAQQRRTQVVLPVYVRMERGDVTRHVVLNTMVETTGTPEKRTGHAVHVFPFTAWGHDQKSRWWSVFYGLAGYERRGEHRRITAFWIPFEY